MVSMVALFGEGLASDRGASEGLNLQLSGLELSLGTTSSRGFFRD